MYFEEPLEQYLQRWFLDENKEKNFIFKIDRDIYFPIIHLYLRYDSFHFGKWRVTHDGRYIYFGLQEFEPKGHDLGRLARFFLEEQLTRPETIFK